MYTNRRTNGQTDGHDNYNDLLTKVKEQVLKISGSGGVLGKHEDKLEKD